MKVTLRASTGARIVVWRERDSFYARPANAVSEPQICLAVDLFEVVAELAGLDLERRDHATEAIALADDARRRLSDGAGQAGESGGSADAACGSEPRSG
jgi:hypothetical protein